MANNALISQLCFDACLVWIWSYPHTETSHSIKLMNIFHPYYHKIIPRVYGIFICSLVRMALALVEKKNYKKLKDTRVSPPTSKTLNIQTDCSRSWKKFEGNKILGNDVKHFFNMLWQYSTPALSWPLLWISIITFYSYVPLNLTKKKQNNS